MDNEIDTVESSQGTERRRVPEVRGFEAHKPYTLAEVTEKKRSLEGLAPPQVLGRPVHKVAFWVLVLCSVVALFLGSISWAWLIPIGVIALVTWLLWQRYGGTEAAVRHVLFDLKELDTQSLQQLADMAEANIIIQESVAEWLNAGLTLRSRDLQACRAFQYQYEAIEGRRRVLEQLKRSAKRGAASHAVEQVRQA